MIKKKSWIVAIAGHVLERYEVTLYGFYAAALAPIFFPSHDHAFSIFLSMGTFAAGYVMRPLGGIVFGHIGDRFGRKKALLNSIFYVSFPSIIIGFLPTYEQIGWVSSAILISFRLIQGLCVGGEYGGATVFFFEHSSHKHKGLAGSIMSATAYFGAVLGTLVGTLTSFLYSCEWAWRLPFLLGGIAGWIIYYMRRNLVETPLFEELRDTNQIVKNPFSSILKTEKKYIFSAFLFGAQGHIVLYMLTVFMNSILIEKLYLSQSHIMLFNTIVLTFWTLLMPFFGVISDKINKIYLISILSVSISIFSFLLFIIIKKDLCLYNIIIMEIILGIFGAGLVSVIPSVLPSLFNTRNRYSGVAFGQTMGQAFLGGTSPLIAAYISTYIGLINAQSFLLIISGFLGIIGSILSIKKIRRNKTENVLKASTSQRVNVL